MSSSSALPIAGLRSRCRTRSTADVMPSEIVAAICGPTLTTVSCATSAANSPTRWRFWSPRVWSSDARTLAEIVACTRGSTTSSRVVPSAGAMSRAKSFDSLVRRASAPGPPPDRISSSAARVRPRVARTNSLERRMSSIARRFCGSSSVLRPESTTVRVVGATTPAQPQAASAKAAASGHAARPDRP